MAYLKLNDFRQLELAEVYFSQLKNAAIGAIIFGALVGALTGALVGVSTMKIWAIPLFFVVTTILFFFQCISEYQKGEAVLKEEVLFLKGLKVKTRVPVKDIRGIRVRQVLSLVIGLEFVTADGRVFEFCKELSRGNQVQWLADFIKKYPEFEEKLLLTDEESSVQLAFAGEVRQRLGIHQASVEYGDVVQGSFCFSPSDSVHSLCFNESQMVVTTKFEVLEVYKLKDLTAIIVYQSENKTDIHLAFEVLGEVVHIETGCDFEVITPLKELLNQQPLLQSLVKTRQPNSKQERFFLSLLSEKTR